LLGQSWPAEAGAVTTPAMWLWRRPATVLAAVVVMAVVAAGAAAADTTTTLRLGGDPDASSVAAHICQAVVQWHTKVNETVNAEASRIASTNPIAVHRQAVITIVVATRDDFAAMIDTLTQAQHNTPRPGYGSFLGSLISRLAPTAVALDDLVPQAQALPQSQPGFDTDRMIIARRISDLGKSLTFTPELFRGLSLRDALSLAGALYNNPTCAPITGGTTTGSQFSARR
jgi:hypothetical protein